MSRCMLKKIFKALANVGNVWLLGQRQRGGQADRKRRREALCLSTHASLRKTIAPPFSWAQLLPQLFLSDQLRCGHASDALKFSQDTHSDTHFKLHPSPLPASACPHWQFCLTPLFWHHSFRPKCAAVACVCAWVSFCLLSVLFWHQSLMVCVSLRLYVHVFLCREQCNGACVLRVSMPASTGFVQMHVEIM